MNPRYERHNPRRASDIEYAAAAEDWARKHAMSIAAKALVPVQPPVESQRPERPLKWYVVQLGTELALYAGFHEPAMERYVAGPYSNRRDACEETDRRTMKKTSRRAVVSTIALVALVFIAARLASA